MEQMGKETIRREALSRALPQAAAEELRERFDWGQGGFRGVPEEREEELLLFLLEYARRAGEGWACDLAEAALDRRSGPAALCWPGPAWRHAPRRGGPPVGRPPAIYWTAR